jgi:hypothetical protein
MSNAQGYEFGDAGITQGGAVVFIKTRLHNPNAKILAIEVCG